MVQRKSSVDETERLDPAFLRARREMWVVLALFGLALTWTIGFCYALGYDSMEGVADGVVPVGQGVPVVWGLPVWVFVGIVLPWLIIDLVAVWFCFYFLTDDGAQEEESEREVGELQGPYAAQRTRDAEGPVGGHSL
jgi:hypothetical protein